MTDREVDNTYIMRILFLTQVLPYPLDAGPKVRSYFTLRYLAEKHSITLVSFVRSTDTLESISHLKSFCTEIETISMRRSRVRDGIAFAESLLKGLPFLITRDHVEDMKQILKKLVRQKRYDAIHADQLWMAPYALTAQKDARTIGYVPRVILDQHNAVYLIPKRMADTSRNLFLRAWLRHESMIMTRFERWACHQFDHVVWVTKEDWAAINSRQSNSSRSTPVQINESDQLANTNSIIPICIDSTLTARINSLPGTHDILFLGGMHWPPNAEGAVWFANDVLPLIRKELPQARFVVIGKQPPEALKTLGEFVITPGYVENTNNYWAATRAFVVPLHAGGGMRVKILDAWARGIPVISTAIGAEGIEYIQGENILIADSSQEFARAVILVLTDKDFAWRLGCGGRITLENRYDWKRVYPAWDKIYNFASETLS
jgi:glycosyltransferase involved in cell wall biosynthesis